MIVLQIAGPFAFGLMLSTFSPTKCLYMAAAAMAASLPVLVRLCSLFHDFALPVGFVGGLYVDDISDVCGTGCAATPRYTWPFELMTCRVVP